MNLASRIPFIIGFIIVAPVAWRLAKRGFGEDAAKMIVTVTIIMLVLAFIVVPLTTHQPGMVRHG